MLQEGGTTSLRLEGASASAALPNHGGVAATSEVKIGCRARGVDRRDPFTTSLLPNLLGPESSKEVDGKWSLLGDRRLVGQVAAYFSRNDLFEAAHEDLQAEVELGVAVQVCLRFAAEVAIPYFGHLT